MKIGGILHAIAAAAAMIGLLAGNANAADFGLVRLGINTVFDAVATGSATTHIIFHNSESGVFYHDELSLSGRITRHEKLPFDIAGVTAMQVGAHDELFLLYYSKTLSLATLANRRWKTSLVPLNDLTTYPYGCGHEITSFALDPDNNFYLPCIWLRDPSSAVKGSALLVFDGNAWAREDVATIRSGPDNSKLVPDEPSFVSADSKGAIHFGYGLSQYFGSDQFPPPLFAICDAVRDRGDYTEHCEQPNTAVGKTLVAMAAGPQGDAHFIYTSRDGNHYERFDGNEWTDEPISNPSIPFLFGMDTNNSRLAVDSNDVPSFAFLGFLDSDFALFYALRTAQGWQTQGIGAAPRLIGIGVDLDRAGLPHIGTTAYAGSRHKAVYVFKKGHDLAASWSSVKWSEGPKPKLMAQLQITNQGSAPARRYRVTCYASEGALPSPTDLVVGKTVVSLAAGASRKIALNLGPNEAKSGRYLLAEISGDSTETNSDNNSAAVQIP